MSALTSLLVRDGFVPVRKIEEALQRQVISGGDIETVLLEMEAVPENVLAGYVGALLELPAATREQVMGVSSSVLALVPREVAVEHRVIPLAVHDRTLELAVHAPLSADETERLGFLLGFELAPHAVCEVRIAAGLAHHYQAELTPRMARLVEKVRARDAGSLTDVGTLASGRQLAGHGAELTSENEPEEDVPYVGRRRRPSGMLLEPAPPESEPPPPPSGRRVTSPGMGAFSPEDAEAAAGPPEGEAQIARDRRRSDSVTGLRRLRGPMTLAAGERLLRQASDRDQILEVLFAFARQFFDYTVLFVVHDDMADGRVAYGLGAPTEEVQALEVPLARPSALSEARRTLAPQVRRLDQTDVDRDVAVGLRRPGTPPAFLMPIAIRQRVVLILYGDRDGEVFDIGAVMELVRFAPRVVEAFEQLIIRKKRVGYHDERAPDEAEAAPSREELEDAGRSMARSAGTERPRDAWDDGADPAASAAIEEDSWGSIAPAPDGGDPSPREEPASRVESQSAFGGAQLEARAEEPGASADDVARAQSFDPNAPPSAVLGIPRRAPPPPSSQLDLDGAGFGDDDDEPEVSFGATGEEPDLVIEVGDEDEDEVEVEYDDDDDDGGDGGGGGDAGADHEADDDEDDEDEEPTAPSRPRPDGIYSLQHPSVDVVHPKPLEGRRSPSGRPPAPSRRPRSSRDARRDDDEEDGAEPRPEVVRVPDSIRSEPPRPPPTGLDADTRSVIVDMGDQVAAQVSDLLRAKSPGKRDELIHGLVALGDAALPVLAQAFPGPLSWQRGGNGGAFPRGRDVSPVARALSAFGERAAPYIAGLLSSAHPDVRFYAALVATEVPHPELMDVVAERVHDEDEDVRRVAVQLLPRLAGYRGFEEIRTVIRRAARIRGKELSRRWQAVDAIAALRDVEMVPKLVELLAEDDEELVDHVHRALVVLTCADFARSHRRWKSWWERNRERHRIEWLIDGLTHADEHVRRLAGEEIKRLTQEYYGYHPGSPRRDRERVAKKYRQWWEQEGQRRFA